MIESSSTTGDWTYLVNPPPVVSREPLVDSTEVEESSALIPPHPLGVKPAGNQYTATENSRYGIGPVQILPDEILAILLEHFDAPTLVALGATSKFFYAFCRSDDLWKILFIE